MRKIVFIVPQLHGGGAERVTAVLANALCRDPQRQIHLLAYRHGEGDYPLDDRVVCHYLRETRAGGHDLAAKLRFFRRTLRQIGPDCVITLAGPSLVALLTAAMAGTGIPLILSERNDPNRYPASRILRLTRLISYALCSGVVFQTRDAMDYFPGHVRRKGTVICNPITGSLPQCQEGQREKRIVNWCRLNPQKNLDLLLDAFGDLAEKYPAYTLEIYGDGEERQRLTEKVRRMGLTDRVVLHGHCTGVHAQVRGAALFVSSSDYEGMSNSMLEAIALGIPSICTDCPIGGAREIIEDGVNGILVPTGDRAALAAAMDRVLTDGVLAEKLSREGRKLRQTISADAVADRWMAFVNKVTEGNGT